MITDYLMELLAALDVPAARRRRILAEVEDHLQCTAAELHAAGLDSDAAEHEAIRRFGPAANLARAFHEDAAAVAGRSAGRAAVMLTVMLVLLEKDPPGIVNWARAGFPAGLLAFVCGQVALVAGALTFIRLFRARQTRGPRGVRLALLLRGTLVVTGCAIVTFLVGIGVIATAPVAPSLPSVLGLGALGIASLATVRMLWRGRDRATAAGVELAAAPAPEEDALSDLAALSGGILEPFQRRFPRVAAWFDLRHHPWRLTSLVAFGAGLALAAAHFVSEGGPPSIGRVPMAVLAGAILAGIEASAVLVGFLTLGRYLGLRPSAGATSDERSPRR